MKQLILLHALVALHLGQFALPADAQVLPLNEDLTISQDGGEYLLSWFGRDNYLYTLETSETLKDWYALPYLEAGFGETLASSISTNADRLFLRVRGTERPELTAEASPRIVCVGETVTFTATAGTEGGFSWSGAASGDSDIVQAQFSTPGLKEATVTYTINGIGISETVTVEVREIVLTASASPATACAGEEIFFQRRHPAARAIMTGPAMLPAAKRLFRGSSTKPEPIRRRCVFRAEARSCLKQLPW